MVRRQDFLIRTLRASILPLGPWLSSALPLLLLQSIQFILFYSDFLLSLNAPCCHIHIISAASISS